MELRLCAVVTVEHAIGSLKRLFSRLDGEGNVKVADFGLSEDVYTIGYFRQGKDDHIKLPFKWMAPESMTDSMFNEKTDVVRTCPV